MAGSLLVCVFVLAAQLVPVVHLATHRDDHAHGPEFDASERGHADRGSPPSRHSNDHGRASVAHFGVALLQGPPPPFLPPPSETFALPADVVVRSHRAAPRRQSPARGPPRLA